MGRLDLQSLADHQVQLGFSDTVVWMLSFLGQLCMLAVIFWCTGLNRVLKRCIFNGPCLLRNAFLDHVWEGSMMKCSGVVAMVDLSMLLVKLY